MMEQKKSEELVRRLAAALRGTELYAPNHPLVQRAIDALSTAAIEGLQSQPSVVIAFIGDEIVVGAARDAGPHVADGPHGAQKVRQLYVHAYGECVRARDGTGPRAQRRRQSPS